MKDVIGEVSALPLTKANLAEVEFSIRWKSAEAEHEERYLARKVNPYRDLLPPGMDAALKDAEAGVEFSESYIPGKLVHGFRPRKIKEIPRSSFKKFKMAGNIVEPMAGRFYPYAKLSGHPGIRTTDARPAFRVLDASSSDITVDFNHPLAKHHLEVAARVMRVYPKGRGRSKLPDWIEEACVMGPGMQARAEDRRTSFDAPYAAQRLIEGDDALYYTAGYAAPELDTVALGFLREEFSKRANPGAKVLDLMAGGRTHLEDGLDVHVTGLGLNEREMEANPRLAEHVVHDLNKETKLPFEDGSFDMVMNSLSAGYMTAPAATVAEAHRILADGGTFAVAFSDRHINDKATVLWTELHDFERMGLVLDALIEAGFKNCRTLSIRNWGRPEDDPLYAETWDSDPVFLVSGEK